MNRLTAPIIIIGSGRSGSTLVMRLLDRHPDIHCCGETNFLTARLWRETFEERFWLDWERKRALDPTSRILAPDLAAEELAAVKEHVGKCVAQLVVNLLRVDAEKRWGFKEIWNGSQSFDHDWNVYDTVYPNARWLHVIRHPFSCVRSVANWNKIPMSRNYLEWALLDWMAVQRRSMERISTGRFIRVRYEDLSSPSTLGSILDFAQVSSAFDVSAELTARTMTSEDSVFPVDECVSPLSDFEGEQFTELWQLMDELEYSIPDQVQVYRAQ